MTGEPCRMGDLALAGIEFDPLVDLASIGAVVTHGCLNQAKRDLEILGRGLLVSVVVDCSAERRCRA